MSKLSEKLEQLAENVLATDELLDQNATIISGSCACFTPSPIPHTIGVEVQGVDAPETATVTVMGKNLANYPQESYEMIGDGTIKRLNDKPFAVATYLENTQYTISMDYVCGEDAAFSSNGRLIAVTVNYVDGTNDYLDIVRNTQVGTSGKAVCVTGVGKTVKSIAVSSQTRWTAGTITLSNIMCEVGAAFTGYESYVEPVSYTPNAEGVVDGVLPVYPTTVVMCDAPAVTIFCKYYDQSKDELLQQVNEITNAMNDLRNEV